MKTFIQFLKESTQSLRNTFPDVLRMMAKTGSAPARISVYPAPKPGRRREGTKVITYPPANIGNDYGRYTHSSDNIGEIELNDTDDTFMPAILGHELAHAIQAAGIVSDNDGKFPNNAERHDIPYSLRPNEIHARSAQAAVQGRDHAKYYLYHEFEKAKKGKRLSSIEDMKDSARANYADVLTDIGQLESGQEEPPSKSFSKPKLLKRLQRRVLGGYEHGFRYAANPATLKSIRRKAEKIRKRNS